MKWQFTKKEQRTKDDTLYNPKAANVQLAVPPTLAAGDWSVESEGDGEGSSGDLHDGVSGPDRSTRR